MRRLRLVLCDGAAIEGVFDLPLNKHGLLTKKDQQSLVRAIERACCCDSYGRMEMRYQVVVGIIPEHEEE